MGVIFPIVFYLLNTTVLLQPVNPAVATDSQKIIYLVKIRWHTGIIFSTDQVNPEYWKYISDFENYKYVDVGWGDEDFYQHPGFDLDLAIKALFTKTSSTLRVAGFNRNIDEYLKSTDYAERLILTDKVYKKLCVYIQSGYKLEENAPVILSEHSEGAVKFYKANGYYSVFNTCNTWIARGLNNAGCRIDENIILSEQLFRETVKYGTLVKVPDN
jgi:uncharacterized protein (TIGR02117 family)